MLRTGEQLPEFSLKDQAGSVVTRDSLLADGPFVLFFYPADFTPG